MSDLRAMTLWPEWAWAVCNLDKRVENRPERVARMLANYDGLLAIHAGKSIGGRPGCFTNGWLNVLRTAEDCGFYWRRPTNGRMELSNHVNQSEATVLVDFDDSSITISAIVAVCRTGALLPPGAGRPWQAPGSWAVELVDVQVLATPVPCRGAQGLWSVGDEVEAAVLREVNRG